MSTNHTRADEVVERPDSGDLAQVRSEVRKLRRRMVELEAEVQECRQLNKRLAEVTDAVVEVLLPPDQRDESRLRELLENYEQRF